MEYGRLTVTMADGQILEHVIDKPSVTIGRSVESQIVIDDVSLEQRHCRISFDDGQAFLIDLESGRGTYVDNQRISANNPFLITDASQLQIGSIPCRIVLNKGTSSASAPTAPLESGTAAAVRISAPVDVVQAGASVRVTAEIRNISDVVDQFDIAVSDLEPSWCRMSRSTLNLVPSARETVMIDIFPPRSAEATAGEHAFWVEVTSRVHGNTVRARAALSLAAFDDLQFRLSEEGPDTFVFVAQNRGNHPVALTLSASSEVRGVSVEAKPPSLEVAAGAEATSRVRVTTAPQPSAVPSQGFRFTVVAADASGRIAGRADGEFAPITPAVPLAASPREGSRRGLPGWAKVGVVGLVAGAIIAAGAWLLYPWDSGDSPLASTPGPTEAVGGVTQTVQTATALSPGAATQGTQTVVAVRATQTAQAAQSATAQARRLCKSGFVWREAIPTDHVCVTSAVRAQVQNDNRLGPGRVDPDGSSGIDSCKSGFVWRDAHVNAPETWPKPDHVCVVGETRSQAASDNAAANTRFQ